MPTKQRKAKASARSTAYWGAERASTLAGELKWDHALTKSLAACIGKYDPEHKLAGPEMWVTGDAGRVIRAALSDSLGHASEGATAALPRPPGADGAGRCRGQANRRASVEHSARNDV